MNWDAIAAIAELLGALGVIASLVYLAGQVRSSGHQARQAAIQSVVNKMNTVYDHMASNREHASLWARGSRGLDNLTDEDEGVQFSAFMLSVFKPYEEIYHYRRDNLVDDWIWESISPVCRAIMSTPGFAEWWDVRADWFSNEFRRHVTESIDHAADYRRLKEDRAGAS